MSIFRNLTRRRIYVAAAVLASLGAITAGIASAATTTKTDAKVDVSGVAAAYNAGDKAGLDNAFTKLKTDLDASLSAKTAASTTTTADPAPQSTSTTTTPTTTSDLTKLKVGIVGDSLTDMGGAGVKLLTTEFVNKGWSEANVKVDGLGGRGIDAPTAACPITKPSPYTSTVIDNWRKAGFDPTIWVVALGTNNSSSTVDCQKAFINGVVDKINSGPAKNYKIYWIGLGFQNVNTWAEDFNNRLGAIAEQKDFTACDYNSWLAENLRGESDFASLWSDGTHSPNAAAYQKVRVPYYSQCVLGNI